MVPPLVTEALPAEGHEVRITGIFAGERRGYWVDTLGVAVWWESIDGPDALVPAAVLSWEPRID